MSNYLIKPLPDGTQFEELVPQYLDKWENLKDYSQQEAVLQELFGKYPKNIFFEEVMVKIGTLNSFYSTHLDCPTKVANRILSIPNFDKKLDIGDIRLVDDICQMKGYTPFSFASKYCSHHYPDKFPIFDSFVALVLNEYQKKDKYSKVKRLLPSQTHPNTYRYDFYPMIKDFKEFPQYKLMNYSYKELDRFLWLMGKEYFVDYKLGEIGELYVIEQKGEHINIYEICVKLHKVDSTLGSPQRKEYVGIATDKDFKFVSQMLNEHCNYVSRADGIIGEYYIDMFSSKSIEKETISEKTAPKNINHDNTIGYDTICFYHKIYDSGSNSNKNGNDILKGLLDDIIKAANATGLNIKENANIVTACKDIVEKYREKKKEEDRKNNNN